jgi:AcrR family transcriptional regulator
MGRPHTPLLDRDRIADAALKLTDRHGDFTILDLARALKVTPAAIYHHVDGRAGIIALLRERMARTVDASGFGQLPWDQALRHWAVSYRDTFAAHPGAIGMLAAEPVADPAVHALYEQAAAALEGAGFPRHTVLGVITAVESFVLGSALDLAAPPVMVTDIDTGATPRLAEAAAAAPPGRARADQAFDLGLDALITGLHHQRSQAGGDQPHPAPGTPAATASPR